MKTIILGRKDGTQPFHFLQSQIGVSGCHARITIDDNDIWWLEDQWSTNGTYIRDEADGSFRRIGSREQPGKYRITPMTFIKLGAEDSTGCSFYAKQVNQYGDYNEEFEFIRDKIAQITLKGERCLFYLKINKLILRILPGLAAFFWYLCDKTPNAIFIKMLIPLIANPLVEYVYNPNEKKKEVEREVKERKKLFSTCPNPECNHFLSDKEIQLLQCGNCKIKHT